jgi:hypothetical protein
MISADQHGVKSRFLIDEPKRRLLRATSGATSPTVARVLLTIP